MFGLFKTVVRSLSHHSSFLTAPFRYMVCVFEHVTISVFHTFMKKEKKKSQPQTTTLANPHIETLSRRHSFYGTRETPYSFSLSWQGVFFQSPSFFFFGLWQKNL
jgi:hypothetical protein